MQHKREKPAVEVATSTTVSVCSCQGVHINLLRADGEAFGTIGLSPDDAEAFASGMVQAAAQIRARAGQSTEVH